MTGFYIHTGDGCCLVFTLSWHDPPGSVALRLQARTDHRATRGPSVRQRVGVAAHCNEARMLNAVANLHSGRTLIDVMLSPTVRFS